jgi:hypothetical protein
MPPVLYPVPDIGTPPQWREEKGDDLHPLVRIGAHMACLNIALGMGYVGLFVGAASWLLEGREEGLSGLADSALEYSERLADAGASTFLTVTGLEDKPDDPSEPKKRDSWAR